MMQQYILINNIGTKLNRYESDSNVSTKGDTNVRRKTQYQPIS
jgi:hypothetical protein